MYLWRSEVDRSERCFSYINVVFKSMSVINETFIKIFLICKSIYIILMCNFYLISTGFKNVLSSKLQKYGSQKTFFSITFFSSPETKCMYNFWRIVNFWVDVATNFDHTVVNQGNNNKILSIKLLLCIYYKKIFE